MVVVLAVPVVLGRENISLKTGELNERMALRTRNCALSDEIRITSASGSESKGSLTVNVDRPVSSVVVFSVLDIFE